MGLGLGQDQAPPKTVLEALRRLSVIDCDTLDSSVPKEIGPFFNCTSDQIVGWLELQHNRHAALISRAAREAIRLISSHVFADVSFVNLAVECAMVLLALESASFIHGYIMVQVNPKDAYSTAKTIAGAKRLLGLCKHLEPSFEVARVCIKIPSTWEGLQACKILQQAGVTTLGTTVFSIEQAVLAAEAGCKFVAPYLHSLKVFTQFDYEDDPANILLPYLAQKYYMHHKHQTKVVATGFTCLDECVALAGLSNLTLAPSLLRLLNSTSYSELINMFRGDKIKHKCQFVYEPETEKEEAKRTLGPFIDNESAWRTAFAARDCGMAKVRQDEAIAIFGEFQDHLEGLMKIAIENAENGTTATSAAL